MECLVTGATGFIGSKVVECLIEKGMEVRCLVRSNALHLEKLGVKLCYGSLFDEKSLLQAVSGVDYIYHFAGQTRALRNSDYFKSNAEGARLVFEAALKGAPNLKRILHVSSLAAMGPATQGRARVEDDLPNPVTPYGESKLESEKIVASYRDKLPITVVRPPVVYGAGDKSGFALFKAAAKGVNFAVRGCDPLLRPVNVYDMAEAAIFLAENEKSIGEAYFTTGDEEISASGLFKLAAEAAGFSTVKEITAPRFLVWVLVYAMELKAQVKRVPNRLNSAKLIEIKYPSWLASNEKLKALGFEFKIPLAKGIPETMAWYKEHGWL